MSLRKSSGANVALAASVMSALNGGVVHIYSNSSAAPANADGAETGVLLAVITNNGAAHTDGSTTNGLVLQAKAGSTGILEIATGQSWRGAWLASGTPSHFRAYGKDVVKGASTTAFRLDGDIGALLSGEEMEADSLIAEVGREIVITAVAWSFL